MVCTFADFEAYALCFCGRDVEAGQNAIIEAGNYIIVLAEKIKAQRLAIAMQK